LRTRVRFLADAVISYWCNAYGLPDNRSLLYLLALALAPSLGGLMLSPARRLIRTKSFAISIMLTGAVLALGGLAVVWARRGPSMGKPARRRRKRRMYSRAPLKRIRGRGMLAKAKAGA
jgi:hypothetical protein